MQPCQIDPRRRGDGVVDRAGIREEEEQEPGKPPSARAAENGEEARESTLQYLKQWMDWNRPFWFRNPSGVTPKRTMGGVLWPESGAT